MTRYKMEDIQIIKQLMSGNHLEQDEIQRARELLTSLLNNANDRFFNDIQFKCCLSEVKQ